MSVFVLMCIVACLAHHSHADNVRPAYLGIENHKTDRYQITWKNPLRNGQPLPVVPVLPEGFKRISPRTVTNTADAVIHKWVISSEGAMLEGQMITVEGLEATTSDVLLRVKFLDGTIFRSVLRPNEPAVIIQSSQNSQAAPASPLFTILQHIDSARVFILLVFVGMLGVFPAARKRGVVLCSVALILGSGSGYLLGKAPMEQAIAWNAIPDQAQTSKILHGLLLNVYRSFSYSNEEQAYDQMEKSISGDLLADVYLQNRDVMSIDEEDQAKVYVDRLDIRQVESLTSVKGGGFSAVVQWDVYGSVNHWEHIHYRCNSYTAKLTLMPKGNYWVITAFDLVREERII
jgi:hypothetical protein